MIILLGSQKGGSGKSTLATNLAALIAASGDVVLVDADMQSTSARWSQDREETDAAPVSCLQKYGNLKATLTDLATRYKHVLVDAGGRDSKELRTALLVADAVLCPFRPSQADVDTAEHLAEVISDAKDLNEKLQAYALLTQCPTNPVIQELQEATSYLADFPELTLLDCQVFDRKVYRDALSTGYGVTECKNPKAAAEIENLWGAISG